MADKYKDFTFYETINRDLIEIFSKSLTFKDVQTIGEDIFDKFDIHQLEGLNPTISISVANAAKCLVLECQRTGRLAHLITYLIQIDGNYLKDKIVRLFNLENFLYHLSQHGIIYDYDRRKLVEVKSDRSLMANWGSLRDGAEYMLTVASVDIVQNSVLVRKHGAKVMEKVYLRLFDFLRAQLAQADGRVWSWAGDGGLLAFPKGQDVSVSVVCLLGVLLGLSTHNLDPRKLIKDNIVLRIGVDHGPVKFFADTGRIVSDTINYASHLEKSGTSPYGMSVSNTVYKELPTNLQKTFVSSAKFEDRKAYSQIVETSLSKNTASARARSSSSSSAKKK